MSITFDEHLKLKPQNILKVKEKMLHYTRKIQDALTFKLTKDTTSLNRVLLRNILLIKQNQRF